MKQPSVGRRHLELLELGRSQCLASRLQSTGRLLLWANAAGDFKFNPMLIYHSRNTEDHKNYANLTLCSLNVTIKAGWQHICLQHGLLNS